MKINVELFKELEEVFKTAGIDEKDTLIINNLLNSGINFYKFIKDYKENKEEAIKTLDLNIKKGTLQEIIDKTMEKKWCEKSLEEIRKDIELAFDDLDKNKPKKLPKFIQLPLIRINNNNLNRKQRRTNKKEKK